MKKPTKQLPKIVIVMNGGLIEEIVATKDADILVIDKDVEGADDYRLLVDGEQEFEAFASEQSVEVNPRAARQLFAMADKSITIGQRIGAEEALGRSLNVQDIQNAIRATRTLPPKLLLKMLRMAIENQSTTECIERLRIAMAARLVELEETALPTVVNGAPKADGFDPDLAHAMACGYQVREDTDQEGWWLWVIEDKEGKTIEGSSTSFSSKEGAWKDAIKASKVDHGEE